MFAFGTDYAGLFPNESTLGVSQTKATPFGVPLPTFDGDAVGQEVLRTLNARDQAKRASADLSRRVFGGGDEWEESVLRNQAEIARRQLAGEFGPVTEKVRNRPEEDSVQEQTRTDQERAQGRANTQESVNSPKSAEGSSQQSAARRVVAATPALAAGVRSRIRRPVYTISDGA